MLIMAGQGALCADFRIEDIVVDSSGTAFNKSSTLNCLYNSSIGEAAKHLKLNKGNIISMIKIRFNISLPYAKTISFAKINSSSNSGKDNKSMHIFPQNSILPAIAFSPASAQTSFANFVQIDIPKAFSRISEYLESILLNSINSVILLITEPILDIPHIISSRAEITDIIIAYSFLISRTVTESSIIITPAAATGKNSMFID